MRSSCHSYGPGADGQRPEGDVELAPLDHLQQLLLVHGLAQNDLDAGMGLGEAAQQRRKDACADALEGSDAEPAGVACLERQHVRLRREQPCVDRIGVTEEDLPGLGQRDGAGATGPLDEAKADDPLESRDLLRDRGLRIAETLGGLAERAHVRDRLERHQMTQVETHPAISVHDRMLATHQTG